MEAVNRRQFIGSILKPAAAIWAAVAINPLAISKTLAAIRGKPGSPEEIARDESYWFEIQGAYTTDRTLINLNNGGVSPAPAAVQEAMQRYLNYSNTAPVYAMWQILEPQRETVRKRLARFFGCHPEEIALTRNASEGLQICQFGLDLKPGDEVLTTNQDYPRMINTFKQRECREGIVMRQFSLPVPAEDEDQIVGLFEEHITPRTRLILMCHMINLTGQILPVKKVAQMARRKGIPVIVDGAHTFAHFTFTRDDLDCEYYATSLHKWLCAPHGTGMLYLRRDRIQDLWPLQAAPDCDNDDIRKFEEIGTHPAANYLAIGEALTFHQGIGPERKAARLIYLRDRWAKRLLKQDRVRLHTSLKPGKACGIGMVEIMGIDSVEVVRHLWERHRIIVTPIVHPEFEGIRVTPHVYTTREEIDRFSEAMETIITKGIAG